MKRWVVLMASVLAVASTGLSAAPAGATASVSASPTLLDFGKVQVGTTGVLALHITNTGTDDLFWTGFSYNPPFGTDVDGSSCHNVPNNTIAAGTSCDILVTLSPTKAGRFISGLQAQFTLASDHNAIVATVDVTGRGRGCPGGGASCA